MKIKNSGFKLPFFSAQRAFSLAELMVVLLIMTVILAASMPILSKRAKIKAAAAATGSINTTAKEGDNCTDGKDRLAVTADGRILTCMPEKTLGDSCDNNTEVGKTAIDYNKTMKDTDNPYVHLVCIAD